MGLANRAISQLDVASQFGLDSDEARLVRSKLFNNSLFVFGLRGVVRFKQHLFIDFVGIII